MSEAIMRCCSWTLSAPGEHRLPHDEWRVDLAVSGSQKGLLMPAGLGIPRSEPEGLSAKIWDGAKRGADISILADMITANDTAVTSILRPAQPMLYGLSEARNIISTRPGRWSFPPPLLAEGVRAAITRDGA